MVYDWARMQTPAQRVPAQMEAATLQNHKPSKGHRPQHRHPLPLPGGGGIPEAARFPHHARPTTSAAFKSNWVIACRAQNARRASDGVGQPAQPAESIVTCQPSPGLLALQLGLAPAFWGFGGHLWCMGRTVESAAHPGPTPGGYPAWPPGWPGPVQCSLYSATSGSDCVTMPTTFARCSSTTGTWGRARCEIWRISSDMGVCGVAVKRRRS